MSNLFTARKEWYDTHKEEAAFFLKVWQRAMDEWAAHRDEIIDAYPQHFAVKNDEEAKWMKALLREHLRLVRRLALPHAGVDRQGEGHLPAAQGRRGGQSGPARSRDGRHRADILMSLAPSTRRLLVVAGVLAGGDRDLHRDLGVRLVPDGAVRAAVAMDGRHSGCGSSPASGSC